MAVINIKTISRLVEKNPTMRNVASWMIRLILHILEAQRLIDFRKLQAVSLDWERGTLDLGDNFTEMLVARAVNEYIIESAKKTWDYNKRADIFRDIKTKERGD